MDSYTDVRGQCCGCRHVSCNTSGPSGRGSFRQTDYPDMNTFPWAVNNDYNVAPAESFAGGQYTGMAYVPWQQGQTTYAPERGLVQGTIFPALDLQFNYGRCGR